MSYLVFIPQQAALLGVVPVSISVFCVLLELEYQSLCGLSPQRPMSQELDLYVYSESILKLPYISPPASQPYREGEIQRQSFWSSDVSHISERCHVLVSSKSLILCMSGLRQS